MSEHTDTPLPAARAPGAGDTPAPSGPVGLGGWLVLPLIALLVQPLIVLRDLYLYLRGGSYPFVIRINWLAVGLDAVVLVPGIALLVLFLRRRRTVPGAFALYYLLIYAYWCVVGLFVPDAAHLMLTTGLGCLVFVPYFACSRRVVATFTRGARDSLFERFHGFLRARGWVTVPLTVAYVALLFGVVLVIDAVVLGRG